jgi:hypothetical protein
MKKIAESLQSTTALNGDQRSAFGGAGHDHTSPPSSPKLGLVDHRHPWYGNIYRVANRGHLVKRGTLRKTATYSRRGGEYYIDRVTESDGGGYLATVRINLGYLRLGRPVFEYNACFLTAEECTAWIKKRAKIS